VKTAKSSQLTNSSSRIIEQMFREKDLVVEFMLQIKT